MKMIPDPTGRCPERPHYEIEELEQECERIMESFLMSRYGQYSIPVPTEALVELLERETTEVNLYCDLSAEGEEVHGVTEFFPGQKPNVSIARELSYQHWREHRKRSTLPHVVIRPLLQSPRTPQMLASPDCPRKRRDRLDGVAGRLYIGRDADAQEPHAIACGRVSRRARGGRAA